MNFTFVHINALPQLRLRNIKHEQVEDGVFRVSAAVVNLGYLPSSGSELAAQSGFTKPVEAKVIVSDGKVLTKETVELGHMPGFSEKKVEWVVNAPAGTSLSIVVQGERAGKHTVELKL